MIGPAIRLAREARGISLRQFAQQMELTPSYYSKVERDLTVPGVSTYERIFNALELDPLEHFPAMGMIDTQTEALFRRCYAARPNLVRIILKNIEAVKND